MQFNLPRLALGACVFVLASAGVRAADPASGTINDSTAVTEWTGGPLIFPNQTLVASDDPVCEEGTPTCDVYRFEVNLSSIDPDNDEIHVSVSWADTTGEADYDIYLYDDATGARITAAESSANPEVMTFPAANGKYKVVVIPFQDMGESYAGKVELAHFDADKGGVLGFAGALGPAGLLVLGLAAWRRRPARR